MTIPDTRMGLDGGRGGEDVRRLSLRGPSPDGQRKHPGDPHSIGRGGNHANSQSGVREQGTPMIPSAQCVTSIGGPGVVL